jgi:hypothetical protein
MSKKNSDKFLNNNEALPISITIDYTPEQLMELKRCSEDILYFAEKYFYIINLDEGRQTIKLYPAQRNAITSVLDNKMTIICASRQVGKSTLMTIICLWYALFTSDYTIAILANKEEQAKEILERIKLGYEELPNWLKACVPTFTNENIKFDNGSKIFISTTSESGIRGKSVNLLFVDEFAHLQSQIIEPFVKSIMPTISSSKSAKIVLVSTPKGAQGKFYEFWDGAVKGSNGWYPVKIHYSDVPGRDADWVKRTLASINFDKDTWNQEFEIQFLETGTAAINQQVIEKLKGMCCPAEFSFDNGDYYIWQEPRPGRIYTIGVDIAEGVGQDFTVMHVLDITDPLDIQHCATYASNKIAPWVFAEKLNQIARSWGRPFLCIERNKEGATVIDALLNVHNYDNIVNYTMQNDKRGVYQNPGIFCHQNSKYAGIQNLKYYVEHKQSVSIYDLQSVTEFESFIRKENKTWGAKKGYHDDRVMAMVWALVILKKDIAERYLDIEEYDDSGAPIKISDPNQYLVDNYFKNGLDRSKPIRDIGGGRIYNAVFNFGTETPIDIREKYAQNVTGGGWDFL